MPNPVARILVADDEAAIRQSVGNILRYADYEVEEAVDGPSALARLARGKPPPE